MLNIIEHQDLTLFNTFGIKAKAQKFVSINSVLDIKELILKEKIFGNKILILGGGSNVLFTQDFDGWVLHNEISGTDILEENDDFVLIQAGGGENWSDFVDYTVAHNLWGLENLSLIPGTVGAAPVQNIGAYGIEQKEHFTSLEAINLKTGEIISFTNNNCLFGYRSSIFKTTEKGNWFILNVTYRLNKKSHPVLNYAPLKAAFTEVDQKNIKASDISQKVKDIRNSKLPDPKVLGNAGSFFKNPVISQEQFKLLQGEFPEIPSYPQENGTVKVPAGWLIEQSGWKGKKYGNTGVHDKQALVLVNHDNAKGSEVKKLALQIQSDIKNRFNITIEPEVLML